MLSPWQCLEDFADLAAVPVVWQNGLGSNYVVFKAAFLRSRTGWAKSFPCPKGCGCAHEVVQHKDGALVAVCRCEPWNCDDIPVSAEQVTLLELNCGKLGRAIAAAFECDAKESSLNLPQTLQIAAFSGAALPVVLTIQTSTDDMRNVVGQLIGSLRERFVLLAPTGRFVDARTRGLLVNANAGFFDLQSHVTLTPGGTLRAAQKAGELFSQFLPHPNADVSEIAAIQLFALRKKLRDQSDKNQKAPLNDVFDLLVIEDRTQGFVADKYQCSPGLISKRVDQIEALLQQDLGQLKALAARASDIDRVGKDHRARRRYERGVADD